MRIVEPKQSQLTALDRYIGVVSRVGDAAATLYEIDPPSLDDWLKQVANIMLAYTEVLTPAGARDSSGHSRKREIGSWAAILTGAGTSNPVVARMATARDDDTVSGSEHQPLSEPFLTASQLDELERAPAHSGCWGPDRAKGSGGVVRCAYRLQTPAPRAGENNAGPAQVEVLALHVDAPAQGWNSADALLELHALGLLCTKVYPRVARLAAWRKELEDRLSPSQRKVLPFLMNGMTNNEIAVVLGNSRYTIHDHVKSIYERWGIRSRFELFQTWRTPGRKAAERIQITTGAPARAAPASQRTAPADSRRR